MSRLAVLGVRGAVGRELLSFAVLVGAGAVVLLAVALVQGPYRTVIDPVPFEEQGVFDYAASLGTGVYDGNELHPPQPLFRRLGERLPLTYRYELRPVLAGYVLEDARGTYSLTAELRQANGWVRAVPLAPLAHFEGTQVSAEGVLDVAAFSDLIRRLEQETGYRSPTFQVRVVAQVDAEARLAGEPVVRSHRQVIEFHLNELELRLDPETSTVEHRGGAEVTHETAAPRYLAVPVVGGRIPYARLPWLAAGGLALATLLALLVGLGSLVDRRGGGASPLAAFGYTGPLVEVAEGVALPAGSLRLASIESLVRLAEQFQAPLFHARAPSERCWIVLDGACLYAEAAPAPREAARAAVPRSEPAPPPAPLPVPSPDRHAGAEAAPAQPGATSPSGRGRVYWGAVWPSGDVEGGAESEAEAA